VVTVGAFDGVHRAHQEIVREVVNRSKMKEGRSVIVTFDPHPKEVVTSRKGPVKLLSTLEEKIELLGGLHVDILLVVEFTYGFSRLSPREFYQSFVVDKVGAGEVVVGYDHMFGRDREAGIAELVQLGKEFNFSVFAVHPYTVAGEAVSSTQIRHALGAGDIDRARTLLGYPYGITGTVVAGDGRGRTIGFPTANISPLSEKKVTPGRGVYFVSVERGDRPYYGMLNIGVRPTVTEGTREAMEVHVFDLSEDIYGENVRIRFLKKLREERKFESVQELIRQLDRDREQSLTYVAEYVSRK
jgi:riboflavin kinase/FMN adenylyltransferase